MKESTLFVGRTEELEGLNAIIGNMMDGSGRCILVEGSPGMGKTALIEEFTQGLDGPRLLQGTSIPGDVEPFCVLNRALSGTDVSRLCFPTRYSSFEEILLVDDSGEILHKAVRKEGKGDHAETLKDTFSAVQDFIKDSFKRSEDDGLGLLTIGKMELLIEHQQGNCLIGVVEAGSGTSTRKVLKDLLGKIGKGMAVQG